MGDLTHAEPQGRDMRKLPFLAIGLLAFALGGPAQAADLGHPVPAHAGDTWTGFYVGGMLAMRGAAQITCWALLTTAPHSRAISVLQ